jgi:hypothetical protein
LPILIFMSNKFQISQNYYYLIINLNTIWKIFISVID